MAALISSQPCTAEVRRLCADAVPSGVVVAPEPGAAVEQDFLLLRPHRTSDDALSAQVRKVGDHDLLVRFRNRDEQLVFEFWTNSFTGTVTPDDQSVDLLERYLRRAVPRCPPQVPDPHPAGRAVRCGLHVVASADVRPGRHTHGGRHRHVHAGW